MADKVLRYFAEEQPLLGAIIWCAFILSLGLLCHWIEKSDKGDKHGR